MKLKHKLALSAVFILAMCALIVDAMSSAWRMVPQQSVGILLFGVLFWVAADQLTSPIEELANQSTELLAGSRAAIEGVDGGQELATIAGNLEEMSLRVQAGRKAMHQFVGDASHELRTPLTVISAYLQLLSQPETLANGEYVKRSLEKMSSEAARMQRLVDDLLQTAELGEANQLGRTGPVDLAKLVLSELESLKDLQPQRPVVISVPSEVTVTGNSDLLSQLCSNLFANIRRHTAPGTELHVTLVQGASWVTLTLEDAGPGLSDEAYVKGIQHFQRYDSSRSRESGGSGLGMTIMASIVQRHGGRMQLSKSTLGGLTTRITLPL